MLTPLTLTLSTTVFLLLHHLLSLLPSPSLPPTSKASLTRLQLPSYALSTIHALIVAPRGFFHLIRLFRAPIPLKLAAPIHGVHNQLYLDEITAVTLTNLILAGYLLADLIHVVRKYPMLGGWDTLLHHLIFGLCAVIAGRYKLYPFTFGWLILGEASTPILNLRWYLIRTNRTSGRLFKTVQILFAVVFFFARVVLYSLGLAYHIACLPQVPEHIPDWAVSITMCTVLAGAVLNLVWMKKIFKLATSKRD